MTNDLPRLPRNSLRPDKEFWSPSWQCYCCHDTGYVRNHLIRLIIPDYNSREDVPIACQNCDFDFRDMTDYLDWRFKPELCQKLDLISREDWRKTLEAKHRRRREKLKINLEGRRLREEDEQLEAETKHKEVVRT